MAGPRRALIVGLGLIGGSLGMAVRARGWDVSFIDPAVDEASAVAQGAANRKLDRLEISDVVVLATPVDAAMRLLEEVPEGQLVTSVCSVMAPLAAIARRRQLRFVAGHPMAGSEKRSLEAARAALFTGRRWFVESHSEPTVLALIADSGAVGDEVDPAEHDWAVAMTSCVPQILSTALAASLEQSQIDAERFGGSGLATFLRLAGSDAAVWEPILEANRRDVERALSEVTGRAQRMAGGRSADDFAAAQDLWRKLNPEGKAR